MVFLRFLNMNSASATILPALWRRLHLNNFLGFRVQSKRLLILIRSLLIQTSDSVTWSTTCLMLCHHLDNLLNRVGWMIQQVLAPMVVFVLIVCWEDELIIDAFLIVRNSTRHRLLLGERKAILFCSLLLPNCRCRLLTCGLFCVTWVPFVMFLQRNLAGRRLAWRLLAPDGWRRVLWVNRITYGALWLLLDPILRWGLRRGQNRQIGYLMFHSRLLLLFSLFFHSRKNCSVLLSMVVVHMCAQVCWWLKEKLAFSLCWTYWTPINSLASWGWLCCVSATSMTLINCLLLLCLESF